MCIYIERERARYVYTDVICIYKFSYNMHLEAEIGRLRQGRELWALLPKDGARARATAPLECMSKLLDIHI